MPSVTLVYPLLVVLLAVLAIAPLEYPGAFQSHTGLLAVYNLINLDQNPLQFLTWAPAVGQTFDLFRSDGPLPYLLAELVHLVGFDYLDAVKSVYALAWVASGLTMFALARRSLTPAAGLLAATTYVYLPFHLATIYVRGAFAESVAWALFPLALLAVLVRSPRWIIVTFTLLFLTQPGLAILFALAATAVAVALEWRTISWARWRPVLLSILGGLVLGALLELPVILRYGATLSRTGFASDYVLPFQLFSSLWGYGTSTGSFLDQFPLQLGVAPFGLTIVAVALAWRAKAQPFTRLLAISLALAIVMIVLTFEIAAPLWTVIGLVLAHPWQLLTFAGLALALVAGTVVDLDERLTRPAMLAVLVVLPVVAAYGYLSPRYLDANPTRPQIAIFGDNEIALLDYRIVGPLRHGATLRLQLQWQALRGVDHDYTVFVHAVNADGNTYAQEDAKPGDGALPTIQWTPGQIISDTHTIQIDVDGPREGYHLEVGLYQGGSGRRALLDNGAESLILPRPGDPEPVISEQLPVTLSR